jgi:hypothetical protein
MARKRMREWRYSSTILDFGTGWSGQLHARGKAPGTHRMGGWLGLRASLTLRRIEKSLAPAFQSVACLYTDWAIPVHYFCVVNKICLLNPVSPMLTTTFWLTLVLTRDNFHIDSWRCLLGNDSMYYGRWRPTFWKNLLHFIYLKTDAICFSLALAPRWIS